MACCLDLEVHETDPDFKSFLLRRGRKDGDAASVDGDACAECAGSERRAWWEFGYEVVGGDDGGGAGGGEEVDGVRLFECLKKVTDFQKKNS